MDGHTHVVDACAADEEARADARFAAFVKRHEGEEHHAFEWKHLMREERCERVLRMNGTFGRA